MVKGALVAGMYPNIVHVDRENVVLTGPKEKRVRFHPTSVLSQPQYKKVRGYKILPIYIPPCPLNRQSDQGATQKQ